MLLLIGSSPQEGAIAEPNLSGLTTAASNELGSVPSTETLPGNAGRPGVAHQRPSETGGTPGEAELDRRERELTVRPPPGAPPFPDVPPIQNSIDAQQIKPFPPATDPKAR